ncbi:MAG: metallophosphoesterase [Gemmatimonadales bacterium]
MPRSRHDRWVTWAGLVSFAGLLLACAPRILPPQLPPIPEPDVVTSIFLLGDAGASHDEDPVLVELARQASAAPRESAIIFLGDNVYPRGLPEPDDPARPRMEERLERQIRVARESGIPAYFIPGNHDWARMTREGWDAVRRSETFIRIRGEGLARQVPRNGCPGPEVIDVGKVIRLVALDTQWWLHRADFPRPIDSVSTCVQYSRELITARLRQVLADSGGRRVIVAGHHPILTRSEHGGRFTFLHHLFPLRVFKRWLWVPLPLLGSLYPMARANGLFAYSQDMGSRAYTTMRNELLRAMRPNPPMLYAAGHDHNLQVFRGPVAAYSVVSGSGNDDHQYPVGWTRSTIYAISRPGFMRLDVHRRGPVRLGVTVIEPGKDPREAAAIWLTDPPPADTVPPPRPPPPAEGSSPGA